jgi:hypothetical protein
VTVPVLQSIAVAPVNPSIAGEHTQQFSATGAFSRNLIRDLTNQVIWSSSRTNVATISNTAGTQGLATGVSAGTPTISATLAGVSGSAALTVTSPSPMIVAEQADSIYPKYNRRVQRIGRPMVDFVLACSSYSPMDAATVSNPANYLVEVATARHTTINHMRVYFKKPIPITAAAYNRSTNAVTLLTRVVPSEFARGGVILVNAAPPSGVSSTTGAFLTGLTSFSILPSRKVMSPSLGRDASAPRALVATRTRRRVFDFQLPFRFY